MTQPTLPAKSDLTYSGTTPADGPTVEQMSDAMADLYDVLAEQLTRYTASTSTGTNDWTKIASIVFNAAGQEASIKLSCIDITDISSAGLSSCDVQVFARQHTALGNDPICAVRVQNLQGGRFGYTQFAAYFSTVDVNSSVINVYVTSGADGVDLNCLFRPILLHYDNTVSFFATQPTDTEANITGGTFDVKGQLSPTLSLSTSTGEIDILGSGIGNANRSYIDFSQSDGTRDGYIGVGSGSNRNVQLRSEVGNVELQSPSGNVLVNGNEVATTQEQSVNLASSGSFTAGTLKIARTGNVVTITASADLTHASAASASSGSGIIPDWARPSSTVGNLYNATSLSVYTVQITSAGLLATSYHAWDGSGNSLTSAGRPNISYVV